MLTLPFSLVSGTAPWVTRIQEIKAATAVNAEADRRLAQVNEEMESLYKTLKTKEQFRNPKKMLLFFQTRERLYKI